MAEFIAGARKALAAGFAAFAGVMVDVAADGVITNEDWMRVAVSTIGAIVLVYYVPNRATPANEYVGEHEAKP